MKNTSKWIALGICTSLFLTGCGKSESGSSSDSAQSSTATTGLKIDQSTPKGTFLLFFQTLKAGDADKIQELVIGNQKQIASLVALANATNGLDQLNSLAKSKLGVELTDLGTRLIGTQPDNDEELNAAKVVINGDYATMKIESESAAAEFKKVDGKWRLVLTEAIVPTQPDFPLRMFSLVADTSNKVAAGIRDGKYKTKDEVENAFKEEMKALYMPAKKPSADGPQ